mmetsp:Transcript_25918/g.28993  ORF Transcript_25918/g.28993 Transcript_25918/m.28993 type:complete len:270 (-) Transcript_25918:202-1011(-)
MSIVHLLCVATGSTEHFATLKGYHGFGCGRCHVSTTGCIFLSTTFRRRLCRGSQLCGGQGCRRGLRFLGRQQGFGINFFFRFENHHDIIERNLGSENTLGIVGKEDFDTNPNDTLSHQHMTDRMIGIDLSGMTGFNHVSVTEFHPLGTLSTEFPSDNDFTTLRGRFHDKPNDTVTGTTDGQPTQQFKFERFGLRLGTQPTILDAFRIQFDGTISKRKPFLDHTGEFPNPTSIFTQDILGAGRTNNNFRSMGCRSHLDTGITIFGQFTNQ